MTEQTAPFSLLFRVRYAECDAQDVVFNARYADYVDLAATEFLRACGLDYRALVAAGLDNQVVRLTLEWQSPARFDDVLCAQVWLSHLGTTSYELTVRFLRHDDGTPVASAQAVYVMMTRPAWQKTPVPEHLRQRLEQGARGLVLDQSGRMTEANL